MNVLLNNITSTFKFISISEKDVENVNGFVNEEMKPFGWIFIEINKDMCGIIELNDKEEVKDGYLLSKDQVLEMNGEDEIIAINEVIDKENGIRFEGRVFNGLPLGFGLLFDENGNRMYEGMIINWNRMGYGVSFNENGFKEYEGYWFNDFRCGNGKSFDLEGNIIYEGNWLNGKEIEYDYEGDGRVLLNTAVRRLKLLDNCILRCFDVSLFILLEELIIGNNCFENVDTFRIDGLNHLKSIKIGKSSFTKKKNSFENNPSRSFHILNCEKLEWIEIGKRSFSDYSGEFELKNLPSLSSIKIGKVDSGSYNFFGSSFVVKDLPNLQSIQLGNWTFENSLSTVISNFPNLKSIQLGEYALYGRDDDTCSLEMKNLPKLEEITSNGFSFSCPRSVILSNIPNLKRVDLPDDSFQNIVTSSVVSNVEYIILFKEVHPLLASMVRITHNYDYIQSIDSTITSIHLPDWTCNDLDCTIFDFSRFSLLKFLIIGDNSFYSVDTFRIDGLNHLKSIKIGKNSFTKKKNSWGNDASRSFHILNCTQLESIEIGRYSYSDYSGEFELKNLPSLSYIKIGNIGSDSRNFFYCSFVVKNLPNLQSIKLGNNAFHCSLSTVISNLPNLKSIKLGRWALYCRDYDTCSLEMKNLPKLEEINSNGNSFSCPRSVILSNIPNLKRVVLTKKNRNGHKSFGRVSYSNIEKVRPLLASMVRITQFDCIQSIDSTITSIHLPNWTCNDLDCTIFNFSRYFLLKFLIIGDNSFYSVNTFRIDGLYYLKSIKIGMNSFTKKKNSWGNDASRSFHILNCTQLESIEIGRYSYSDYSGEFELKNLPSLSYIKIGEIGSFSWNFICSSFVVKNLPNLQSIVLGNSAFHCSLSTVISNLPNLKSIHLGYAALYGRDYDTCSLEMKDLPKLEEINSNGNSFEYSRSVILSNIPNLKTVNLRGSFWYVKTKSISNVSSPLSNLVEIHENYSNSDYENDSSSDYEGDSSSDYE